MLESSDGFEILTRLRQHKSIRIAEADFTRWRNDGEHLMDTFYAASAENLYIKDVSSIKQIINLIMQIKKEFKNVQVYVNNYYELNGESTGLVKYVKLLEQIH